MERSINIDQIIIQMERLDYHSKINLLEKLVKLLKQEEPVTQPTSITSLKGLGKDIWQNIDASSYVASERESWE